MKFGPETGSTLHLEQMIIAMGSRTSIKREEDSAVFLLAFLGGEGVKVRGGMFPYASKMQHSAAA